MGRDGDQGEWGHKYPDAAMTAVLPSMAHGGHKTVPRSMTGLAVTSSPSGVSAHMPA